MPTPPGTWLVALLNLGLNAPQTPRGRLDDGGIHPAHQEHLVVSSYLQDTEPWRVRHPAVSLTQLGEANVLPLTTDL